jgi:hypothetical protein
MTGKAKSISPEELAQTESEAAANVKFKDVVPEWIGRPAAEIGGQVIGAGIGAMGGSAGGPVGTIVGGVAGGTAGYVEGKKAANYLYGTPEGDSTLGQVKEGLMYSMLPKVVGKTASLIGSEGVAALNKTELGSKVAGWLSKHPAVTLGPAAYATHEILNKAGVPRDISMVVALSIGGHGIAGEVKSVKADMTRAQIESARNNLNRATEERIAQQAAPKTSTVIGARNLKLESAATSEEQYQKAFDKLLAENPKAKSFSIKQITDAIEMAGTSKRAPGTAIGIKNLLFGTSEKESETLSMSDIGL